MNLPLEILSNSVLEMIIQALEFELLDISEPCDEYYIIQGLIEEMQAHIERIEPHG